MNICYSTFRQPSMSDVPGTVVVRRSGGVLREAVFDNKDGGRTLLNKVVLTLFAILFALNIGHAQQPVQAPMNPLDEIPSSIPFSVPYGPPITLDRAQLAAHAAVAEANKRGWSMNIAVVDSGTNLVTFLHMDNSALGSIVIAQHKARTSVKFRRPTKVLEDLVQKPEFHYVFTLDDIIASRGGIPLIEDGKLIGAIGCSGGTSSQDEAICAAGAKAINK
jgi:glc operon protein GlcG